MKKKVFFMLILALGFSLLVTAQEREKTEVSWSFGVINASDAKPVIKDNFELATNSYYQLGLNLNMMFFKNSDFGNYFNFYIKNEWLGRVGLREIDSYYDFSFTLGIGYRKPINNNISFYTGIGPEIKFSEYYYINNDNVERHFGRGGSLFMNNFGIGIGGTAEIRLRLFRSNLSFAGGAIVSSNFLGRMEKNFGVYPYIGLGWN
ncbi:MAG: hypothetical protein FWD14_08350 [Treponema sp.]|nr:hypothetical protein [Treponema sp.]